MIRKKSGGKNGVWLALAWDRIFSLNSHWLLNDPPGSSTLLAGNDHRGP